jgi:hypothetical protein
VQRARINSGRVLVQFRAGAQIQNHGVLARLQFLMQFIHRDSRHAQLAQQAGASGNTCSRCKARPTHDQGQRAAAQAGQRRHDLFQLMAEQDAHQQEASHIKQRTHAPSKKRNRGTLTPELPASGGASVLKPGNEFRDHHSPHPVAREHIPCVRRTHESGSSEMRHSRPSTRWP